MKLKNIQTEVDASYLYQLLSEKEEDENVAEIFREMSEIEKGHALAFLKSANFKTTDLPAPSWRAKILKKIGAGDRSKQMYIPNEEDQASFRKSKW